jgi:SagB-type dehydrogenase family enzyme
MKSKTSICIFLLWIFLFCPFLIFSQEFQPIQLPVPQTEGGRPLMEVLKDRSSSREFSSDSLPVQTLSNLLWAAWGINRPESGKRTAPSAVNRQEMDIYVITTNGVFLYDATAHALVTVLEEDIRDLAGIQDYVKDAPVNLIYVSDLSKMGNAEENQKLMSSFANTGFIAQNVYLYCASEGLAAVVRGMIDKPALETALKLRPDQRVILGQTVGYPKKID